MRTVRNILRHELIGLHCEVVKAKNKGQIGISGKVIDETQKTLNINGKKVEKNGTVFRITVDEKKVDIEGDYILSRPEDRIKKKIEKW